MREKRALKLQTTTLWYYPSQQYADEPMGDPRYPGRTPAYVIWNLLERYTRPGDLVVDPFAGGGNMLQQARKLGRRIAGYEIDSQWVSTANRLLNLEPETETEDV